MPERPDLRFSPGPVRALPSSMTPYLGLTVKVQNPSPEPVQSLLLNCQLRLDAPRRSYNARETALVKDLFGEKERWGRTLKSLLWTQVSMSVPGFEKETEAELLVPCSYDFNQGATKYFYALEEGEVPVSLLFSGTVFFQAAHGGLQVRQIPWTAECPSSIPVSMWRTQYQAHVGQQTTLPLSTEVFDRLHRFRTERGLTGFDEAISKLLEGHEGPRPPRGLS